MTTRTRRIYKCKKRRSFRWSAPKWASRSNLYKDSIFGFQYTRGTLCTIGILIERTEVSVVKVLEEADCKCTRFGQHVERHESRDLYARTAPRENAHNHTCRTTSSPSLARESRVRTVECSNILVSQKRLQYIRTHQFCVCIVERERERTVLRYVQYTQSSRPNPSGRRAPNLARQSQSDFDPGFLKSDDTHHKQRP